jgi:membrane associated rhomboid family serine protease
MREPVESVSAAFPRPGRALKAVLLAVGFFAIAGAIVWNWAPGGPQGQAIMGWLDFQPSPTRDLLWKPWTFVTSGIMTYPEGISHALFALLGLYFLGTDLEKRWGGARFLRFLAVSVILGNVAVLLVDRLPIARDILTDPKAHFTFHPPFAMGPAAAITACAMAWSKENATKQIRLFFFLPVTGRTLYWVTIAAAILSPLFVSGSPEGVAAPFGGIAAGLLFSGTPSPIRSVWLRLKLALMRRQGHALTVESLTGGDRPRAPKRGAKGGPSLRVVQGGLDDDLKNRKPPKDKRYLN